MKNAWLLGGLLALSMGMGCSAPQTKEAVWVRLERAIEGPHLWQSALGWRPVYNDMIDMGFSPPEASHHIRMAIKYGPQLRGVVELLKDNETPEELANALEVAYAEGQETRHLMDRGKGVEPAMGYRHRPIFVGDREKRWRELANDLERPPIHANALLWRDIYLDMCKLGMSYDKAAKYILRAAKFGPSSNEVSRMLEESDSLPKLKADLSIKYSQSVDRLYEDEPEWLGYWHFPPGAEAWIEEQRKREEAKRNAPPPQLPPELQAEMQKKKEEAEAEVPPPAEPTEPEPDYPEADFPEEEFTEPDLELEEEPDLDTMEDLPPDLEEEGPLPEMGDETGPDEPPPLEDELGDEPPIEDELGDEPPVEDDLGDEPPVEDEEEDLPGLDDE